MSRDPDLMRAASHVVELYGAHGASVAAKRAHILQSAGSPAAAEIWRRIAELASSLLADANSERRRGNRLDAEPNFLPRRRA